ncbi:hypothetical protein [Clostridium kluyveri]|uniref:Uncharacterized protein n=2 Tax=Clostridium kluyveri TaxID=1534 RepID=A5N1A5_CLOK5|nr:hypothetical protein [Clostridium kluyveri]EDK34901.1 Hypothetical protein CKL_2889 [Clostridium kluyveri DSM 555]BAH07618.1 hypothetical protein CKR_2567 [Clostridium kluyveri NBRC 12016]
MKTRCRKCIFEDIDGGKYPCNDCSEIMDMKRHKSAESHFEPVDGYNKNIKSKERLKKKLSEVLPSTNKKIIYAEYEELENENIMLTAFLDSGNDIIVYQILDIEEGLVQNMLSLDKDLLHKINKITKRGV